MYIDLILGGQVAQNIAGGSILLWMDNFCAHRTPDIDTLLTERNVYAAMYPENMTAHLQVLDLIVNGPIKRHIRACRSHELVDNFQMLKSEYEAAPIRPLKIDWVVPRISAKTCIQNLRPYL